MNNPAATIHHPWIDALQGSLNALERALLQGDAPAVEQASAGVQAAVLQCLQGAPKTAEFSVTGSRLQLDVQHAAHRFAQLRQAVLRAHAQSQRATHSLLPRQAQPTYDGNRAGALFNGGAGRAYITA